MAIDMASNDGVSIRRRWVWLVLPMLVAGVVLTGLTGTILPVLFCVFFFGFTWMLLRPRPAVVEPSFAWGLDEIPQGPAMRELALRRIRDRKSLRRLWRESLRARTPREQRQARMGMAMAVAGLAVLGWQVWTGSWTPSVVLLAASLGFILFMQLISWLAHPDRGWLRREEARAREDRMMRAWTPRGIQRKLRWNMVLVGGSLMLAPLVVVAVWLAPSVGIVVPAAWATGVNGLLMEALIMLMCGAVAPMAMLFVFESAPWRRRCLALAEAVLWAPEDGVDEDGAMEGGVL